MTVQLVLAQAATPASAWWHDPNWVIAALTVALFLLAFFEHRLNKATLRHSQVTERAYVTMSHHPPGVDFGYGFIMSSTDKPAQHREVTIRVSVQNYGNTPATITDMSLRAYVAADLPETPEYLAGPRESAFLVKDNAFTVTRQFSILEERMREMLKGDAHLWFYGYVDYIDQFGQRHRAGYARVFDRSADDKGRYKDSQDRLDEAAYRGRNNLPFAVKAGYNYDRPRRKGEGKDWS